MKNNKKLIKSVFNQKGFTLIEVLAAVTIFIILVGMISGIYQWGVKSFITKERKIDLQQNVRIAVDEISRDLRQAVSAELVNTGVGYNNELQYKIPVLDSNNKPDKKYETRRIFLSGTNLQRQTVSIKGAKSTQPFASNISKISFSLLNQKIISISITGKDLVGNQFTLKTKVRRRVLPTP